MSESNKNTAFRLTIPREHGAWGALLGCYLIGAFAGGTPSWRVVSFLALLLAMFFLRATIARRRRMRTVDDRAIKLARWTAVYALLTLGVGCWLVLADQLWWLLAIGAFGTLVSIHSLMLVERRVERTAWGELTEMIGVTFVVPSTAYVARGTLGIADVGATLVTLLFLIGSVLRVRFLVRNANRDAPELLHRIRSAWLPILMHLLGLLLLAFLGAATEISERLWIALLPATLGFGIHLFAPSHGNVNGVPLTGKAWIRRIGFEEAAQILALVVFTIWGSQVIS